ncbi:MAG: hypothetical protein D6719_12255 [Candidatus Dadabacteria bacterium]|nr:MAG: hypothetical protein D6719_12255 [Candidatus Dadabacteria bacterium]
MTGITFGGPNRPRPGSTYIERERRGVLNELSFQGIPFKLSETDNVTLSRQNGVWIIADPAGDLHVEVSKIGRVVARDRVQKYEADRLLEGALRATRLRDILSVNEKANLNSPLVGSLEIKKVGRDFEITVLDPHAPELTESSIWIGPDGSIMDTDTPGFSMVRIDRALENGALAARIESVLAGRGQVSARTEFGVVELTRLLPVDPESPANMWVLRTGDKRHNYLIRRDGPVTPQSRSVPTFDVYTLLTALKNSLTFGGS